MYIITNIDLYYVLCLFMFMELYYGTVHNLRVWNCTVLVPCFFCGMLFCILPMVIHSVQKCVHAYYGKGSVPRTGHTHTYTLPNKHSPCSWYLLTDRLAIYMVVDARYRKEGRISLDRKPTKASLRR